MCVYSGPSELRFQVGRCVTPAQVEAWSFWRGVLEEPKERAGVARSGAGDEAGGSRRFGRTVAHAEGGEAGEARGARGVGRVGGGEDQEPGRDWEREGDRRDLENRGNENRDVDLGPEAGGEVAGLRLGPGQQDDGARIGHGGP
jgi:hypothetical protein